MDRLSFLLVVMTVLSVTPLGGIGSSQMDRKSEAERELIQLELELAKAVTGRDLALLERLTADDFIGFNPSGERLTKTDVLAQNKSPEYQLESLKHEDIEVRVFGGCAVATARSVVKGRHKGQDVSGQFRYMRVWIKREGRWQGVAAQATAIPQP